MIERVAGIAVVAAVSAVSGQTAFTIGDSRIRESSGLVASPSHPGVFWTHNDSGDTSRIFALNSKGSVLGVWKLDVAAARDWEAITAQKITAGSAVLWVGDIGDNSASRDKGVLVHRIVEPVTVAGGGLVSARSYRLRYPDGPQDAEAMFVGRDGRLRIVSKGLLGGTVYVAPKVLSTSKTNLLKASADAPPIVTDAAELPDGDYIVRNYSSAYVYAPDGTLRQSFDLPRQDQGESIAVVDGGKAVLVGSEGKDSKVLRVVLPRTPTAATPTARPTAQSTATSAHPGGTLVVDDDGDLQNLARTLTYVAVGAAALLAGVLVLSVVVVVRSRRRRGSVRR